MSVSIQARSRRSGSKSELQRLRGEGQLPAVIYGKNRPSQAIAVDEKELLALLRENKQPLIGLSVDGKQTETVMIQDVQKDSLSGTLLHIDFREINMSEPIRTSVRINWIGEPVGVKEGGILNVLADEVEIRCLPSSLPESLPADISGLQFGDSFLAEHLTVPEGVELLSDPKEPLATILAPQRAEAAEEAGEETPEAEASPVSADTEQ